MHNPLVEQQVPVRERLEFFSNYNISQALELVVLLQLCIKLALVVLLRLCSKLALVVLHPLLRRARSWLQKLEFVSRNSNL